MIRVFKVRMHTDDTGIKIYDTNNLAKHLTLLSASEEEAAPPIRGVYSGAYFTAEGREEEIKRGVRVPAARGTPQHQRAVLHVNANSRVIWIIALLCRSLRKMQEMILAFAL